MELFNLFFEYGSLNIFCLLYVLEQIITLSKLSFFIYKLEDLILSSYFEVRYSILNLPSAVIEVF